MIFLQDTRVLSWTFKNPMYDFISTTQEALKNILTHFGVLTTFV